MFTDVEGCTPLTQHLGDVEARELMRVHERIVRAALWTCGGWEVKHMGDGFLIAFTSARRALDCAVMIQRTLAPLNECTRYPLRVRIGVNAGEPIAECNDLFGSSVIAAARVMQLAAGGQVLVSDVVRQLAAGSGHQFTGRGALPLRGFDEPTTLFELLWTSQPALIPDGSPVG
jgi:class 3 adenylate cyclase